MADPIVTPPVNTLVSIQPLSAATPERDAGNMPPQLAALPAGSMLEGFVVGRDPQNNLIMRTPGGDLQVHSDVFVKTGSAVVIRVDASQDGGARLVSIDGLQPQDYAAQNARPTLTQDTIVQPQLVTEQQQAAPASAGQAAAASHTATAGNQVQPQLSPLPSAAPSSGASTASPSTPSATPTPLQALFLSPPPAASAARPMATFNLAPLTQPIPPALQELQAGTVLKATVTQLSLPQKATVQTPASTNSNPSASSPTTQGHAPASGPGGTAAAPTSSPLPQLEMASARAAKAALGNDAQSSDASGAGTQSSSAAPEKPAAPLTVAARATTARLQLQTGSTNAQQTTPAASAPASTPQAPADRAPPLPEGSISAVVIGHDADGGNVLQTHVGTLKVYTPTPLPVNTQLGLKLETDPAAPKQNAAPLPYTPPTETGDQPSSAPITPLSRDWHALDAMIASLPGAAQLQAMTQNIPRVGSANMTSALLFFLAAVKGGDLKQWMGSRNVDRLDARLPALAARMKDDMSQMSQLFNNSPIERWSGMLWPLMVDGRPEYARFYLRDEQKEQSAGKGAQGGGEREQRFLVELDLSHLGGMQLDGFLRQTKGAGGKQFDLMVRSARHLEPDVAQEIRQRFDTAMQVTGYKGYIGFQQGEQHFVRPLATGAGGKGDANTILA